MAFLFTLKILHSVRIIFNKCRRMACASSPSVMTNRPVRILVVDGSSPMVYSSCRQEKEGREKESGRESIQLQITPVQSNRFYCHLIISVPFSIHRFPIIIATDNTKLLSLHLTLSSVVIVSISPFVSRSNYHL